MLKSRQQAAFLLLNAFACTVTGWLPADKMSLYL
jgi:hypothetical protein